MDRAQDKVVPPGIVAAAVTPRREGPELDLAAAFELIDFLSSKHPSAIALMSATGEFPHFTLEERSRLVSLAVKRSRVPVIAGVSHTTLDGALSLAKDAAYAGAAALLLMPPPFFRYAQEEVREFLHNFAEQLDDDIPLLVHNAPCYASEVAQQTADALLVSRLFAGVVDDCAEAKPPGLAGAYLSGNDSRYAIARKSGCDGALSPAACAIPEVLVALDNAIASGAAARTELLELRLREFLDQIAPFPEPFGIREALAVRGIKAGIPATPPGPRTLLRITAFRNWFKDWLSQVLKEIG